MPDENAPLGSVDEPGDQTSDSEPNESPNAPAAEPDMIDVEEPTELPAEEPGEEPAEEPAEPVEEPAEEPAEEPVGAAAGLTAQLHALEDIGPLAAGTESSADETAQDVTQPGEPDAQFAQTSVIPTAGWLWNADAEAAAATIPAASEVLGAEGAAAGAGAVPATEAGAEGAAAPAPEGMPASSEPRSIDLGPEQEGKWWVWALAGVAIAAVLGVGGYAWWWSSSRPITVPDLVGKQPAEATQIVNDLSLRLGDVSEVPTDVAPAGTILSQKPADGTKLKPGGRVGFVVSAPPDQAKVPDLSEKTQVDAERELSRSRLRPVVVITYNSVKPAGLVVSQLPTAGVELPPGAAVAVVVSQGPAPTVSTVPKLAGLSEEDATKLLAANNLKIAVYRGINASVTSGEIMNQSPTARASAPYESVVQVLVSQGAGVTSATVPGVTGLTKSQATKRLKASNFKVETRTIPNSTVAKGKIIAQMPTVGMNSAPGAVVGLLVSGGNVTTVAVPSIVGTGSAEATKAIEAVKLRAVEVGVETSDYTPGTIFGQYPGPGVQYTPGFPVVMLVAEAPRP